MLLGLLIADGLGSGIAVLELKRKKGRIEQITEELQKTSKFLENALTKRIQKRLVKAFPNIETEKMLNRKKNLRKDADFLNWRVCLSSGIYRGYSRDDILPYYNRASYEPQQSCVWSVRYRVGNCMRF